MGVYVYIYIYIYINRIIEYDKTLKKFVTCPVKHIVTVRLNNIRRLTKDN